MLYCLIISFNILQNYITRWTESPACWEPDGPLFNAVLALHLWVPTEWRRRRIHILRRLLCALHGRWKSAPTTSVISVTAISGSRAPATTASVSSGEAEPPTDSPETGQQPVPAESGEEAGIITALGSEPQNAEVLSHSTGEAADFAIIKPYLIYMGIIDAIYKYLFKVSCLLSFVLNNSFV
ncbi:unnamed protein product [Protopolystoma xenopodis]|uniref:E3 ubiquitin ligase UBR4 C-terminal domain-containing protein n=1 Tax=Protopolystoma xenopodis TaxID=117903 RepID=A0A3S5ADJ0_9PLAT|nr:unnamed protein product [Protopolystoma xenopodis]